MNRISAAAALALLAACPHDRGTSTHAAPARVATVPPDAAPPPAAHPSEAECAQLVQHVIALELHDPAATKPSDRALTDADVANVAREVGPTAQASCRTMTIATYHCALAAATIEALGACD